MHEVTELILGDVAVAELGEMVADVGGGEDEAHGEEVGLTREGRSIYRRSILAGNSDEDRW